MKLPKSRNWQTDYAKLVFWAWCYTLIIHQPLVWVCVFLTAFSKQLFGDPVAIPVPPAPDISLLVVASTYVLGIGAVNVAGKKPDKWVGGQPETKTETKEGST